MSQFRCSTFLAALVLAAAAQAQTLHFESMLSGAFEAPATNASTATGRAIIDYNAATGSLAYSVTVSGMVANAAHIHSGAAGVPGGVIITLSGGPTSWSGSAFLPAAQLTNLLHDGLYVNVHSVAFPNGEIRGQIRAPRFYHGFLSGANEVPPVASAASALGRGTLAPSAGSFDNSITVTGTSGTSAHIHDAPAGAPGALIFALSGGPTVFSSVTSPMSNTQLIDLMSAGLYWNVHTAAFPDGELRDQIQVGGLNADADLISVTNGGTMTMQLDATAAQAGKLYLLLGSVTGTSPGLPAGTFTLPLNLDAYLLLTLSSPNVPPLGGSLGFLNGAGEGTSTFTIPPGSSGTLAGVTVQHAYVVVNLISGAIDYASNAVSVTLLP